MVDAGREDVQTQIFLEKILHMVKIPPQNEAAQRSQDGSGQPHPRPLNQKNPENYPPGGPHGFQNRDFAPLFHHHHHERADDVKSRDNDQEEKNDETDTSISFRNRS